MACAVMPTGRVCGTPIGMPCVWTTRVMPRRHDELADGLDDALPLEVGLGAGQQVVRLAVAVGQAVEQHRRVVVLDPAVGVEDHGRAAAAVVEQLVDVEGRDDLGVARLEQVTAEDATGCGRRR